MQAPAYALLTGWSADPRAGGQKVEVYVRHRRCTIGNAASSGLEGFHHLVVPGTTQIAAQLYWDGLTATWQLKKVNATPCLVNNRTVLSESRPVPHGAALRIDALRLYFFLPLADDGADGAAAGLSAAAADAALPRRHARRVPASAPSRRVSRLPDLKAVFEEAWTKHHQLWITSNDMSDWLKQQHGAHLSEQEWRTEWTAYRGCLRNKKQFSKRGSRADSQWACNDMLHRAGLGGTADTPLPAPSAVPAALLPTAASAYAADGADFAGSLAKEVIESMYGSVDDSAAAGDGVKSMAEGEDDDGDEIVVVSDGKRSSSSKRPASTKKRRRLSLMSVSTDGVTGEDAELLAS
eukprot:PLAT12002.1.p1 GENE.PLAT12002.1~~PLAT12002.1.p1  ORF type:complete len:351 (-),score=106.87 PLAT12002.1:358-1410(-)